VSRILDFTHNNYLVPFALAPLPILVPGVHPPAAAAFGADVAAGAREAATSKIHPAEEQTRQ